jgi:hypothetical protein
MRTIRQRSRPSSASSRGVRAAAVPFTRVAAYLWKMGKRP